MMVVESCINGDSMLVEIHNINVALFLGQNSNTTQQKNMSLVI